MIEIKGKGKIASCCKANGGPPLEKYVLNRECFRVKILRSFPFNLSFFFSKQQFYDIMIIWKQVFDCNNFGIGYTFIDLHITLGN